MYSSLNNKTLIGTVEETRIKMPPESKFPIFEMYHGDVKWTINIVCYSENKTSFALDPDISLDLKKFVNIICK